MKNQNFYMRVISLLLVILAVLFYNSSMKAQANEKEIAALTDKVDDGRIDLSAHSYLYIVTLEGYQKIQRYFGSSRVVPIYIEVEDGERLLRAIARERQQKTPQYEEMCRRFLADAADFSEEKLTEAGITRRFINKDMEGTIREITEYIRRDMSGMEKQDKRISIWR